jgi:hypothetical protein
MIPNDVSKCLMCVTLIVARAKYRMRPNPKTLVFLLVCIDHAVSCVKLSLSSVTLGRQ